jgi:hypothetical protein
MQNEVQEPQEGRWSPRRPAGPDVIETLRGSEQAATPARSPREEVAGRPATVASGRNPWRGEAQGSSGPCVGISPRAGNGLPERARPRSCARTVVIKPRAARANGMWVRGHREVGSRSAKGNASKGKAQERARHETGSRSSGEKESARRADEPWRRNVPGEANPGRVGSPDRKRCRARNPKGGAATERTQRPALVKL